MALNAHGTALLGRGNYTEAAAAFCAALKLIQSPPDAISAGPSETLAGCRLGTVRANEAKHERRERFGVFRRCFVLVGEQSNDKNTVFLVRNNELYHAVLLYNIAFTYHLSGICLADQDDSEYSDNGDEEDTETYHLEKALQLYHVAASILCSLDESDEGLAVFLAVSNNLAAAALKLGDHANFSQYRHVIGEILKEQAVDFFQTFFFQNYKATKFVQARADASASAEDALHVNTAHPCIRI